MKLGLLLLAIRYPANTGSPGQLSSLVLYIWIRSALVVTLISQREWLNSSWHTSQVVVFWDFVGPQQFPFAPQQELCLV